MVCGMKYKTVVATGIVGSGTTMMAGVLEILGIPMVGEQHNRRMWEDKEISLNLKNKQKLESIIAKRNETHKIWGFKYPNLNKYFDMLSTMLINPCFLVIFRDPVAIFYKKSGTLIDIERNIQRQKK